MQKEYKLLDSHIEFILPSNNLEENGPLFPFVFNDFAITVNKDNVMSKKTILIAEYFLMFVSAFFLVTSNISQENRP